MRILLPGVLCGVALLLGGVIAYDAFAPLDPVQVEIPRLPPRREAAPAATYVPPSAELFAEIDTRPLFSSERKPLADLRDGGTAAATSDFVLVGVIMGGQRAVALLRNRSTQATVSAALGDLVGGWRVARIEPTAVTLRSASGDFVVPLDGPANRPPSSAMQPAAPPAAVAVAPQPQTTAGPPANTAKPVLPAHSAGGTIAPDAIRGSPRDPTTGEPTL